MHSPQGKLYLFWGTQGTSGNMKLNRGIDPVIWQNVHFFLVLS